MDAGIVFAGIGALATLVGALFLVIRLVVWRELSLRLNGLPGMVATHDEEIRSLRRFRHEMANRWIDVEVLKHELAPHLPPRKAFEHQTDHDKL